MKRKKKQEEAWAEDYLRHVGYTDICFEPDGNVPPDFLINGNIAIEVRRLNQHYKAKSGKVEGLEQLAVPRRETVERVLKALGPPTNGVSWFVSYSFKRPQLTENWDKRVRDELEAFRGAQKDEGVIQIDRNFRLELMRASAPGKFAFLLGGYSDYDAGGWVISELEKSLTHCIAEKTLKIAPYRSKYPTWWLIFIDFVARGASEPVQVKHNWDRVLMVHPASYEKAYEIKSPD